MEAELVRLPGQFELVISKLDFNLKVQQTSALIEVWPAKSALQQQATEWQNGRVEVCVAQPQVTYLFEKLERIALQLLVSVPQLPFIWPT